MEEKEWKERRELALKTAEDNKHAWFLFKDDQFYSCARCGIIKNEKNKDRNCRGFVKIELR